MLPSESVASLDLLPAATPPGVGPEVGVAFVATIDDPQRFAKSRTVGAHLGLAPRRYQSGEKDFQASISKCGDTLMRQYWPAPGFPDTSLRAVLSEAGYESTDWSCPASVDG